MKYEIKGTPLPVVICEIEPGESLITEGGSMSWMTPNMVMETVSGGLGKSLGRMFSGESLFLNKYTAEGGQGMIAFASSFPGKFFRSISSPMRVWWLRSLRSWLLSPELNYPFTSRRRSEPVFSAVKDLLCKNFPDKASLSSRLTGPLSITSWPLDKRC